MGGLELFSSVQSVLFRMIFCVIISFIINLIQFSLGLPKLNNFCLFFIFLFWGSVQILSANSQIFFHLLSSFFILFPLFLSNPRLYPFPAKSSFVPSINFTEKPFIIFLLTEIYFLSFVIIQISAIIMPKDKGALNTSSNHINRIKRYQQFFDAEKTYFMTPHSRSLPKKKNFFKQNSKLSNKKPSKNKRDSLHIKKTKKKQASPQSKQKASRYDLSVNRQYDSPSRQNQELDFILAERPKNKKTGCAIEATVDRAYDQLTKNNLNEAIDILKQALKPDQNNYDLNYLLGVCHLLNGQYDQAINIFDMLLSRKTRKNIYLLLSVCYKKMEDYEETEKILNQCLKKNPKSYETYIYRGKLYLKLKKYKQALSDFEKAIKINPEKQIAYIGKGDCLRLSQRYDEAKTTYAKALSFSKKINLSVLLRRAICNMELKRYDPAFEDIEQLLHADPQNSQALYFKGLIYNKQKMQNESIICYEQSIKFNTNKKAVTRSIYQLAKIKIQHRDYYEALYTLQRAKYLDIQQKVIRKFKVFADGVTELMKKNYENGIKILSQLIDNSSQKPLGNFLKPLVYSSRSYGFMSLCKFQQAKEDLQKLQSQFSLDIPNLFNKFICEGIMACNSQKYQQSLAFFSKAGKIMPNKLQPYFYKAVSLISFISKLIPKQMKEKQKQYLESAMKTVNKCEREIQNNPSLFLVRSFLHYALGQGEKALEDLDKCLADTIKHQPIHFYLNGLILAEHFGRYQEAIEQFKKALNTQSEHKIPEIYLNRAKCLLLLGQINSGFVDLQTYMSFRPSSPQIHIWAGHLLFYIGAAEDAAKAYSNISNISKNCEVLLYRAKCYLNSKNVIDTLANLKQILDVKYDNKVYFDYHVLDALRECSDEETVNYIDILGKVKQAKQRSFNTGEQKFGNFVKQSEYQFYKGVLYFYSKDYKNAGKNFQRALKLAEQYISEKVSISSEYLQFYKLSYSNIPYNYFQCLYNISLCQIMGGNIMKGIKKLKLAVEKCPESQTKNQLQLFIHLLQKQIRSQFDRKPAQQQQQEQQAQLNPFPSENRLCSIFPQFVIPLSTPLHTRIYFCLPTVEKPDIKPRFDEKLYDEFNMATIQIKPEAPWIKRSEQGVIFTDDIVGCDVQLSKSSSSQSNQSPQEQEQFNEQQQDDHIGHQSDIMQGNGSEGDETPVMMKPADLKKMFKLDPKVQAKLAKLK